MKRLFFIFLIAYLTSCSNPKKPIESSSLRTDTANLDTTTIYTRVKEDEVATPFTFIYNAYNDYQKWDILIAR